MLTIFLDFLGSSRIYSGFWWALFDYSVADGKSNTVARYNIWDRRHWRPMRKRPPAKTATWRRWQLDLLLGTLDCWRIDRRWWCKLQVRRWWIENKAPRWPQRNVLMRKSPCPDRFSTLCCLCTCSDRPGACHLGQMDTPLRIGSTFGIGWTIRGPRNTIWWMKWWCWMIQWWRRQVLQTPGKIKN